MKKLLLSLAMVFAVSNVSASHLQSNGSVYQETIDITNIKSMTQIVGDNTLLEILINVNDIMYIVDGGTTSVYIYFMSALNEVNKVHIKGSFNTVLQAVLKNECQANPDLCKIKPSRYTSVYKTPLFISIKTDFYGDLTAINLNKIENISYIGDKKSNIRVAPYSDIKTPLSISDLKAIIYSATH